ncbi:hypothetical protein PInf_003254 [Phytophthora infestans]|nr:hypothetical protein PInf_003254 [Phytophthora infestans]
MQTQSSGPEDDNPEATTAIPTCFVDGDPNMMDSGAQTCTGLNSDEDEDLHEEAEDEDDAEDDDCTWVADWEIGELTDEDTDEEQDELPASAWSSVAKDSEAIKAMKSTGWEYDPTYKDLYDEPVHGRFGPNNGELEEK